MIEILKSRLEDALKEATQGISIYTLLAVFIYTLLISFRETHLNQILYSLMNTDLSSFIGEHSILLKIKIKSILYACIAVSTINFSITALRSEYFDLLYLTILKNHIEKLKALTTANQKDSTPELLFSYRRTTNKQNLISLILIAITFTSFQDGETLFASYLLLVTCAQILWSIHKSAKFLIAKILPAIISTTPGITTKEIDNIFSQL